MNKKKSKSAAWQLIPIQVAIILIFALACLYLIPHFIKKSAEYEAVRSAQLMANQFILMREYYTENVISKVIASNTTITPHYDHKSMPEGIPLPASFILDMSDLMQESSISLKFYSPYPFPNRKDRVLDTFSKDAWEFLSKNTDDSFVLSSNLNNVHTVRVAVADIMANKVCVDCHNSHHLSPKTDWKLGDLRGVLEISNDISSEVKNGLWTGRFLALSLVLVFGSVTFFSFLLQRNEFKKSEKLLADNLKELKFQRRALDEHAIVSIADVKGNITYTNDKFSEISGYSHDELIGKNHRILRSDEHPPEFFAEMWRTIASGKNWNGEIKNQAKDGTYYWLNATIVPSFNDEGKPFQYVAIRTDISKRKEAESKAEIALKKAERASKAKTDFLANMSHELRTPLNAVIGFSDAMLSEIAGPINNEQYSEYAEHIRDSGSHLLHLINEILDLTKVEAGKLKLIENEVILKDIISSSISTLAPRSQSAGVHIVNNAADTPIVLWADDMRVKQVLLNLLSNAVKFTKPGSHVVLDVVTCEDGSCEVSAADQGVGMNDEDIRIALDPFGQVDSIHTRHREGTGLGLPLTQGLMELHGGTLEIKSDKGSGTTVTVTFPKERIVQKVC